MAEQMDLIDLEDSAHNPSPNEWSMYGNEFEVLKAGLNDASTAMLHLRIGDKDEPWHRCFTELANIGRKDRQRDWSDRVAEYFAKLEEEELAEQRERQSCDKDDDRQVDDIMELDSGFYQQMLQDGCDSPRRWVAHRYRQSCIGKQFHGFMHLPLAVRYLVYEHALVRGKIFVLNRLGLDWGVYEQTLRRRAFTDVDNGKRQRYIDIEEHRMPDTRLSAINPICNGLLKGVSRAVQEEAEYVFWGVGNQFVFPPGPFHYPLGFYEGTFARSLKPAKSVSYAFDMRDAGYMDPYQLRKTALAEDHGEVPFENMTTVQQREILHDMQEEMLIGVWMGRCEAIGDLPLQKLQLDVEECYCPVGCCRKVGDVFTFLEACLTELPLYFEVLGWKNESEKNLISDLMASGGRFKRDDITFAGKIQAA
jgi:hypothetical protein